MLCYRTDQLKLYQLIGTNPDNWRFIMDLASGIDAQFAAKLNAARATRQPMCWRSCSRWMARVLGWMPTCSMASMPALICSSIAQPQLGLSGHQRQGRRTQTSLDGYDASAFVRSVNGAVVLTPNWQRHGQH